MALNDSSEDIFGVPRKFSMFKSSYYSDDEDNISVTERKSWDLKRAEPSFERQNMTSAALSPRPQSSYEGRKYLESDMNQISHPYKHTRRNSIARKFKLGNGHNKENKKINEISEMTEHEKDEKPPQHPEQKSSMTFSLSDSVSIVSFSTNKIHPTRIFRRSQRRPDDEKKSNIKGILLSIKNHKSLDKSL